MWAPSWQSRTFSIRPVSRYNQIIIGPSDMNSLSFSSTKPWVANTTAELVAITPSNWDQKQVVHVQHVLRR